MNLSAHSRNRIMKTFSKWHVPKEFADPMYSYLIHGYNPGSCFTSVLANDFVGAIGRSHPGNTIEAFKALAGWMGGTLPREAYGSYKAVDDWCYLKEGVRRVILEEHKLIYTAKEELFMVIKEPNPFEVELY